MNSERLAEWLKGHAAAIALVETIHDVVELWDDLIDRDCEIEPERINRAFYALFVTIPRNGFYQQHFALLNPLIESAILDWHTANALERDETGPETAYGLRCTGQAVTTMCARIIGGVEWALQVNKELRTAGESYADYAAEFGEK